MKLSHLSLACASAIAMSGCGDVESTNDSGEQSTETTAQAASTATHTSQKGAGASVSFEIENGSAYVSVYENVAKQARNVYLNFGRSTVDPSSYLCEQQTYCWDPANPSPTFAITARAGT
jgi:uncharacterized protein YceK